MLTLDDADVASSDNDDDVESTADSDDTSDRTTRDADVVDVATPPPSPGDNRPLTSAQP